MTDLIQAAAAARAVAVDQANKVKQKEFEMPTKCSQALVWTIIVTLALLIGAAGVFAFSLGKYEKVKPSSSVISTTSAAAMVVPRPVFAWVTGQGDGAGTSLGGSIAPTLSRGGSIAPA